jgi:four helix bundle protein
MEKPKFELAERSFQFSLLIIKQVEFMKDNKIPFSLIDQLVRSSTSVGANIMEGQGSGSTKELIRYYRIALKSANETKYWLRLVKEGFQLSENNKMMIASKEVEELSKIIASIILKLNKKLEV